jgi:hypothetical protein
MRQCVSAMATAIAGAVAAAECPTAPSISPLHDAHQLSHPQHQPKIPQKNLTITSSYHLTTSTSASENHAIARTLCVCVCGTSAYL